MIKADRNRFTKNSGMLLAMNAAKILFPLITLPYLTRVLSTDAYGTVVYVKSVISYMQLMVDFGFLLSATKEIVNANGDIEYQNSGNLISKPYDIYVPVSIEHKWGKETISVKIRVNVHK